MKKKTIKIIKAILPLIQHSNFLDAQERAGEEAFDTVVNKMIDACAIALKTEKLAKSDNPNDKKTKLPTTWTKEVPNFHIDITKIIEPIIEKHLKALKFALLGTAAGEDAINAVKELGLYRLIPKGIIVQSFAHSIDSQKEYLSNLLKVNNPRMNKDWVDLTVKFIEDKSGRFVDKTLYDLKAKALASIDQLMLDKNLQNAAEVARQTHEILEQKQNIERKRDAVKEAVKDLSEHRISLTQVKQSLRDSFKDSVNNWNTVVGTETSMASGVAATQSIIDIASKHDREPIVCMVDMNDSRVSKECHAWSRDTNNNLKYFRLSSLKPPGYNLGLKKKDWKNSINPRHFGCRCMLTYVPKGYKLDNYGSLVKLEDGETIEISS